VEPTSIRPSFSVSVTSCSRVCAKNRFGDSLCCLEGVDKFLPVLSALLDRFECNWVQDIFTYCCWASLELRENRCSESHGLLKPVYEALPSIYTVFSRVWQCSVQEMATNDYWVVAIFAKIVAVKSPTFLRGSRCTSDRL